MFEAAVFKGQERNPVTVHQSVHLKFAGRKKGRSDIQHLYMTVTL